jgi:hypothetical protein
MQPPPFSLIEICQSYCEYLGNQAQVEEYGDGTEPDEDSML